MKTTVKLSLSDMQAHGLFVFNQCYALVRQFTRQYPGVAADFHRLHEKLRGKDWVEYKDDIHLTVEWFAGPMLEKLRKNAHKGHWHNCTPGYLSRRLHEEAHEVSRALARLKKIPEGPASHETVEAAAREVIREAADVANFAMMIADNVRCYLPGDDS